MWFQELELYAVERERGTYSYDLLVPPARSTAEKIIFVYSTRNQYFKRMELLFKIQRRGPPRRKTRKLLALEAHSRGCTKELVSGLPSSARWKRSELEQKNDFLGKTNSGRRASIFFVVGTFRCMWAVQHRRPTARFVKPSCPSHFRSSLRFSTSPQASDVLRSTFDVFTRGAGDESSPKSQDICIYAVSYAIRFRASGLKKIRNTSHVSSAD